MIIGRPVVFACAATITRWAEDSCNHLHPVKRLVLLQADDVDTLYEEIARLRILHMRPAGGRDPDEREHIIEDYEASEIAFGPVLHIAATVPVDQERLEAAGTWAEHRQSLMEIEAREEEDLRLAREDEACQIEQRRLDQEQADLETYRRIKVQLEGSGDLQP